MILARAFLKEPRSTPCRAVRACARALVSACVCASPPPFGWRTMGTCVRRAEEERRIWTRLPKPGSSGGHNRSRLTQRAGLQQVARRGGGGQKVGGAPPRPQPRAAAAWAIGAERPRGTAGPPVPRGDAVILRPRPVSKTSELVKTLPDAARLTGTCPDVSRGVQGCPGTTRLLFAAETENTSVSSRSHSPPPIGCLRPNIQSCRFL